jgi:hypothetical protein
VLKAKMRCAAKNVIFKKVGRKKGEKEGRKKIHLTNRQALGIISRIRALYSYIIGGTHISCTRVYMYKRITKVPQIISRMA